MPSSVLFQSAGAMKSVCIHACVCVCVRACVRACVHVPVHVTTTLAVLCTVSQKDDGGVYR